MAEKLYRSLEMEYTAKSEENPRTIEFSFSSEKPAKRYRRNNKGKLIPYEEILAHDSEENIDFSRLRAAGSLLYNHDSNKVIGRIDDAYYDAATRRCRCKVTFDTDYESYTIFEKVRSGSIKGVSFGYLISDFETKKENGIEKLIATKWMPYEVTITPIPMDENVGIGRSLEGGTEEMEEKEEIRSEEGKNKEDSKEESKKEDEKENDNNASEEEVDKKEDEESEKDGKKSSKECEKNKRELDIEMTMAKNEKQRCLDITKLCRSFNIANERVEEFIEGDKTLDEVRAILLDEFKEKKRGLEVGGVEVTGNGRDNFTRDITSALMVKAGYGEGNEKDEIRNMAGMGFRDIAIQSLKYEGIDAGRMNNDELFKRALSPGGAFASVMDNTVNKSMAKAYQAAPTTFEKWTTKGSETNFKGSTRYRISEAGELTKIAENGEFEFDEMKDEGVKTSVATFGKSFGLTREALINDDLGILTRVPMAYVVAAKRGINKLVYKTLASNPTIYDGQKLFDESKHKNQGTAGAMSVESIGEFRKLLRKQTNLRGEEVLNIPLKYILVPAALETKAEQLLLSVADINGAHSGVTNPFRGKFEIISDAELDGYSEAAYYGIGDKNVAESIVVSYLNGKEAPTLESQIAFDRLGINYRIFIDYGVNVVDYRAMVMNAGE